MSEEPGTLAIGEVHPASHNAYAYLKVHLTNPFWFSVIRESMASSALSGNRLAEVCWETLRRFESGEPVSDRYLLGLAWFIRDLNDLKTQEEEKKLIVKKKRRKKNVK